MLLVTHKKNSEFIRNKIGVATVAGAIVVFGVVFILQHSLRTDNAENDRIAAAIGLLALSQMETNAYEKFLDLIKVEPTHILITSGPDYDGHDVSEGDRYVVRLNSQHGHSEYRYVFEFNTLHHTDGVLVISFRVWRSALDGSVIEDIVDKQPRGVLPRI